MLAAAVLLAVAVARPVVGVLVAVPVLLFAHTVAQYPGLDRLQSADEAVLGLLVVAAGVRILCGGGRLLFPTPFRWVAVFLAVGLVSGVVAGVPATLLLTAAVLAVKGWIFGLVVAQVPWREPDVRSLVRLAAALGAFLLALSFVNLVVPGWFTAVAAQGDAVDDRWGFPSLVGPFLFPIQYGQVVGLVAGALAGVALAVRGRAAVVWGWSAAAAGVLALLSARRLVLVAVLVAVLCVLVVLRSGRVWLVVAGGLPLALVVSLPALADGWRAAAAEYLDAGSEAARTLLTLRSVDVAAAHFPWGAGFGRYGSFLAGVEYSPEYRALGFAEVFGLMPEPPWNDFLTDTFWPAVLGETGFLGTLAYLLAIAAVFRAALLLARSDRALHRAVGLATGIVWVQVLVLSPAGPVLTAPATVVVPFLLLGLSARLAAAELDGAAGRAAAPAGRVQRAEVAP
jgi:hypothetical protein